MAGSADLLDDVAVSASGGVQLGLGALESAVVVNAVVLCSGDANEAKDGRESHLYKVF